MENGPVRLIIVNETTIKGNGTDRISGIMLFESGTENPEVQFTLISQHLPKGTVLEMNCYEEGTNPSIVLEPTSVTKFPDFSAGIVAHVPAGFTGQIDFSATCRSGVLDLNCGLKMIAAYAPPVS
jgi:hypothetical protein